MKRLLNYLPTFVVACLILYLSVFHHPSESVQLFTGADKLVHLMMYLTLAFVMVWDMKRVYIDGDKTKLIAFVSCSLYGGLMELCQQYFTPFRTGDWLDWLADCVGVVIGILIAEQIWKRHKKETSF